MRNNATAVAQQAISEAHAALASKGISADGAEEDIAAPADEAVAQAALEKPPSVQTMSLAPSSSKAGPADEYPNPSLTPGALLTTDASTICTPGYGSSVRDVSTATKEQVYAEYGVSYPQPPGAYEVDHFIPLEMGGSNDIRNLWLKPAAPAPGFHEKDEFENFEHGQVCNGTISVAEAQSRMISDRYLYWHEEIEGATPTISPPVQSASVSTRQSSTAAEASPAYYTSSYHTAKYWYPASCSGWHSLSSTYLEAFPTLDALLAKYPDRDESPGC